MNIFQNQFVNSMLSMCRFFNNITILWFLFLCLFGRWQISKIFLNSQITGLRGSNTSTTHVEVNFVYKAFFFQKIFFFFISLFKKMFSYLKCILIYKSLCFMIFVRCIEFYCVSSIFSEMLLLTDFLFLFNYWR